MTSSPTILRDCKEFNFFTSFTVPVQKNELSKAESLFLFWFRLAYIFLFKYYVCYINVFARAVKLLLKSHIIVI